MLHLALLALATDLPLLEPTTIPVSGEPRAPVAVDLGGDAGLDLVVAQKDLDQVAIFLRAPDGAFAQTGVHATGRAPASVAAGDVDGDGHADLVVANSNGPEATLLLGDGEGAFVEGAPPDVPFGTAVALGDVDGDGHLDLVAAVPAGRLLFLAGAGDGTFSEVADISAGGAVANFELAHIDANGLLDVVAATNLGGVALLLQTGPFAFEQSVVSMTFGPQCDWVAVADVDEDGDMDVAFVESDAFDTCPSVRLGNGDGTFGLYTVLEIDVSSFQRVAFARVDGDDDPDGLSVTWNTIRVRYGASGPGFSSSTESHALGGAISGLIAADLDGDGFDEVVATSAAGELVVLNNLLCSSRPVVASAAPAQVPALASPSAELAVSGCGLDLVTGVSVAGSPLGVEQFTVEGPSSLVIAMPPAAALGPVSVLLLSPSGAVELFAEYVAPEPLLVLGNGGALADGEPTALQLGSAPGDALFLFASPQLAPSSAPGLVELAIGNGFSSLFVLGTLVTPAAAWTQLELAFTGLPPGLQVHFQGVVLAAAGPSPPYATTNAVTGTVVP